MNRFGRSDRSGIYRLLLGAVGLVLLIGSLTACGLPVFGGEDEGPNPGPPTGGVPDIPELTADERALAMQLVNDPEAVPEGAVSVPELAEIGRVSYEIESVGGWHTSKDLRKLGAVVSVVFSEPIVIDATLPVMIYDDEESSFPPYTTDIKHAVFVEVGDLHVLIDLEHEQVVRIVPGSGEYIGPGADQQSNTTTMLSSSSVSRLSGVLTPVDWNTQNLQLNYAVCFLVHRAKVADAKDDTA